MPCAPAAILEDPQKYKGKSVPAVGEHISLSTMAQIVSDVTGKTVKWVSFSVKANRVLISVPGSYWIMQSGRQCF